MKTVEVYYQKTDHLTRLMTALHLLEKQGVISCKYIEDEDKDHAVLRGFVSVAEIRIDGKRIAFDMSDAPILQQERAWEYLADIDMLFERSHIDWSKRKDCAELTCKVQPYGFNFYVNYPGNPAYTPTASGNIMKRIVRDLLNNGWWTWTAAFEGQAKRVKGQPKIIFMTRLWDPDDVKIRQDTLPTDRAHREMRIQERKQINEERILICRELKRKYGSAFCGGVQKSRFAEKMCPDLILPSYMTLRMNYLAKMKRADICIGSMGLEKSIGWKTGEYVAAARAIVCEEPEYILPGGFEKEKNYLPYEDVESCLEAVDKLVKEPERIYQMQLANEKYYQDYLRPEQQLLQALRKSGIAI